MDLMHDVTPFVFFPWSAIIDLIDLFEYTEHKTNRSHCGNKTVQLIGIDYILFWSQKNLSFFKNILELGSTDLRIDQRLKFTHGPSMNNNVVCLFEFNLGPIKNNFFEIIRFLEFVFENYLAGTTNTIRIVLNNNVMRTLEIFGINR